MPNEPTPAITALHPRNAHGYAPMRQMHSNNYERRVQHRLTGLMRFATDEEAMLVPAAIRGSVSRSAWREMSQSERTAHLAAYVRVEVERDRAERAERERQRVAEAQRRRDEAAAIEVPDEPVSEQPVDQQHRNTRDMGSPRTAGTYWVACADGCGTYLRAKGPQPQTRYVAGHNPRAKRRT